MSRSDYTPSGWFGQLTKDGWTLFASYGVRSFAYGFLSVVLGLYLAAQGLGSGAVGGIFTAALVGGAAMTMALTAVADRIGRRRVLLVGAVLMALAGAVFALTSNVILLIVAAVLGTISPSGKEVGPFLSIEQATLPQIVRDENRTSVFAAYNIVGSMAGALGALVIGLPTAFGLTPLTGYRALVWAYSGAALVLSALFAQLSPKVEAPHASGQTIRPAKVGLHRSRGAVAKLAALFAVDAFAGGFIVQGLIAYWFHLRYGVDDRTLGTIFFATNLFSAVSFLAAVPIARRIGLLRTMVFTHLPSNVLLLLVPLMPGLPLAVTMLLARHLLSQLDVPTRQSYTMAIVEADERSAAAGLTSVARNAAAISPAFSGVTLAVPALGVPFLVAGGLKIIYDLLVYAAFHRIRPPEELHKEVVAISNDKT